MLKEFIGSTAVDVVDSITYEKFSQKYLAKLQPVIIRGGLGPMPAIGKWDMSYMQKKIGDKRIQLDRHHNAEFEWSMQEYFDQLTNSDYKGPTRYLTQANIVKLFPELLDDLLYPEYGLPDWKSNPLLPKNMFYDNYQMELLMGKAGTGFFLHYDRGFINAFVGQIYGEKEVVLIPPEDTPYLYANNSPKSDVDIWNLDFDKFPDMRKVRPAFYTLKPGDLVYIPASWWHSTKNKSMSIGVTFNSINRANWKLFSKYLLSVHKATENKKYPTFILSSVLKIVGWIELIKQIVLGNKPRLGSLNNVWGRR